MRTFNTVTLRKAVKSLRHGLWWTADAVPVLVPAAIAAFGIVAMLLLIGGQLRDAYVWPLGLTAAAIACWIVIRAGGAERPGARIERRACDVLVLLSVLLWGGFNVLFTSEHVYTDRDPATYSVTAGWLIDHPDLNIAQPTEFGGGADLEAVSAGFSVNPEDRTELYAQGNHLLPALLGLGGRLVGDEMMLRLNVLTGMAALLAVYGFARLLARPRWAVVITGCLALTLPLLTFSRETYTEPLTAAFTFGALTLLWTAQERRRRSLWLLAGLLIGAGAMARIDAYLTVAAVMAASVIMLAMSPHGKRKATTLSVGLLWAGMAVTSFIGWLDARYLSTGYYFDQWRNMKLLFLLMAVVAVVGVVVVAVSWRSAILKHLHLKTERWRPLLAALVVLLIGVLLASRPLWQESYAIYYDRIVDGQPVVDRDYAEGTVFWLMWYLGPVFAVVGSLGMAVSAARAMRRNDLLLVAALLVVGSTTLLYLMRPNIYPDQIWASRRLLPVIMPGLLVFGAVGLEWIYRQKLSMKYNVSGQTLATVLATLGVIAPLFITLPFLFTRTYAPQFSQLTTMCDRLPEKSAVIWVGEARMNLIQPTRTFCDVPVVGVKEVPDYGPALASAAQSLKEQGLVPVVGVYSHQGSLLASPANQFATVSSGRYLIIEPRIGGPPRTKIPHVKQLSFGQLQPDGSIKPL